jgi:hypothetical protein
MVGKARQKAHQRRGFATAPARRGRAWTTVRSRRRAACPRAGAPVVGRGRTHAFVCRSHVPFGPVGVASSSEEAVVRAWWRVIVAEVA